MRKSILIHPKFQIRLVLLNLLSIFIVLSLIFWGINEFIAEIVDMGKDAKLAANHPFFKFLNFQKSILIEKAMIASAIAALASIAINLFYSHRLTGPIIRISNFVKDSINGKDPKKLSLRKSDYLKELADQINELVSKK